MILILRPWEICFPRENLTRPYNRKCDMRIPSALCTQSIILLFWSKSPDNSDSCLLDSSGFLLGACDHPKHPPEQGLVVLHVGGDGLVRVGLASAGALQLVIIDPGMDVFYVLSDVQYESLTCKAGPSICRHPPCRYPSQSRHPEKETIEMRNAN